MFSSINKYKDDSSIFLQGQASGRSLYLISSWRTSSTLTNMFLGCSSTLCSTRTVRSGSRVRTSSSKFIDGMALPVLSQWCTNCILRSCRPYKERSLKLLASKEIQTKKCKRSGLLHISCCHSKRLWSVASVVTRIVNLWVRRKWTFTTSTIVRHSSTV